MRGRWPRRSPNAACSGLQVRSDRPRRSAALDEAVALLERQHPGRRLGDPLGEPRVLPGPLDQAGRHRGRDRIIFLVSTVVMLGFLYWKPEWVWVVWPFQFTALAGMFGRL